MNTPATDMNIEGTDLPKTPSERSDHALLRNFLADRDIACPQCGYNLRSLMGDICPECGDRIALQVAMVEPKVAAGLAGLIGLSAGAGLNGLLLVYIVIIMFRFPRPSFSWDPFITINGAGLVVLSLCILIWLRRWRWLRRQSISVRWGLAAACWALTMIDIIVFSFTIR
jgi:DNA-directed RNA polymerase subunit RPC12/RpoP